MPDLLRLSEAEEGLYLTNRFRALRVHGTAGRPTGGASSKHRASGGHDSTLPRIDIDALLLI